MRPMPPAAALLCLLACWICPIASADAPSPSPSDSWLSGVRATIEAEEYQPSWQGTTPFDDAPGGYQAPNRAHAFRTWFLAEGIRLVPRSGNGDWLFALTLDGWGRAAFDGTRVAAPPPAPRTPGPAAVHVAGERVEYRRAELDEWYVNGPDGLEQGFTLGAPPAGESPRVIVKLALGGTLDPRLSEDRQALDFVAPDGRVVLHYAKLMVFDALGRALPAWMDGWAADGRRGICLIFDDRDARYPVTIDPLVSSPSWSAVGDLSGARFGYAVAGAGDVNGDGYNDVIVGAPGYDNGQLDEGRAYVFLGSSHGLSTTSAWRAESDDAGANLGHSVATAGDVNNDGFSDVIVGAPLYTRTHTDEGAAFVWLGSASGLGKNGFPSNADWATYSEEANARLGGSVATAGDVNRDGYSDVIVGAEYFDGPFSSGGRATVHHGSSSGLHVLYDWAYWGLMDAARAGRSVSTAGDVNGDGYSDVIVGVPGWSTSGRAIVFAGSPAGVSSSIWTEDGQSPGESFGTSVGVAGLVNDDGYSDVIIGAPYNDAGATDRGAAYVYHGSASGVLADPNWSAVGSFGGNLFGTSVGTAGDVNGDGYSDIVVGASEYDGVGRVFVYYGGRTGVYDEARWSWSNDATGTDVGASVATAGDVNGDGYSDVIVGAPRFDSGLLRDAGAGYVFHGGPDGVGAISGWSRTGTQADALFGQAVASAGDLNDDGYDDIMVGLPMYDGGAGADEGRVLFYRGSASGPPTAPTWTLTGGQAGARFGSALAPLGDVNLDGFADVAIGAPRWQTSAFSRGGGVFVYFGSGSGLSGHTSAADADWEVRATQNGASFGATVASAGDVNDDGYTDLLVGAPDWNDPESNEGRVFLWYGPTIASGVPGTTASATWSAQSNQSGSRFGRVVAGAGDVNGDGYSDVLVSAPDYDNGPQPAGRAFVWYGSHFGLGSGTPSGADWTVGAEQAGSDFGASAAGAGDVNGDGYADVMLGAPLYAPSPASPFGRVCVYHGSAAGLHVTPDRRLDGLQLDSRFGAAIAGAGDVNGDGFADIVVGATHYDQAMPDFGVVYVFHGSAAGVAASYSGYINDGWMDGHTGTSVAAAGDVNADGYADVIFGAPDWVFEPDQYGYAAVRFGGGLTERSRAVEPKQSSLSDSGTIHRLARAGSPSSFWIGANVRGSIGRGEVILEWEVEPLGSGFDGAGTLRHAIWSDTESMTHLEGQTSGLASNTLYHWRARVLRRIPTSPFQQRERWFTRPWSGWNESKLRLWQDSDTDGVIDNWDCAPADWTAWSVPSEARDLLITSASVDNLTWSAPSSVGGTVVYYDVLRSTSSTDFSDSSAACLESNDTDLVATDAAPPSGQAAFYLVRAENVCGGALGNDSEGHPIAGRDCP